jgi:ATP-dependent Clp protease ATP-binding subunit ClpC
MFERYTESARRALFFARYEATRLGSRTIETEHVLLGLTRRREGLLDRILAAHDTISTDALRDAVQARAVFQEAIPTSVEVPFSAQTKRALVAAMGEADRLLHSDIGVEHLLLGLLHEPESMAGDLLIARGVQLGATRDQIVRLLNETRQVSSNTASETEELLDMVDLIEVLVCDLTSLPAVRDAGGGQALVGMIRALRQRLERRTG